MIKEGSEIRVYKLKGGDSYHTAGEYKYGKAIKQYPNFWLVELEGKYKECFKTYELEEVSDDDKINKPRQKKDARYFLQDDLYWRTEQELPFCEKRDRNSE